MWSLLLATAAVGYAALRAGSNEALDLTVVGLLVACAGALRWMKKRRPGDAPRCSAWIQWPLVLLPIYVVLQLIPLPLGVLDLISPARAEIARSAGAALGEPIRFAPLSLVPAAAVQRMIVIGACILLVFLVRELAWDYSGRPWIVISPVLAIGLAEAAFGIVQAYYLGAGEARGTWANRNHFANSMAICLPFPVAFATNAWLRWSYSGAKTRLLLMILLGFCASAVLLLAVTQSLSRMGFAASIAAVAVLGGVVVAGDSRLWNRRLHRMLAPVTVALLTAAFAAFLLAPPELISRFGKVDFIDGLRTHDRLLLWKESRSLFSAYPVFGTGLGGYESGFLTYKVSYPMVRDAYAHNDYLQYLIELGGIGFAIAAASAASVIIHTGRALSRCRRRERLLAAACIGTFVAVLLHSTVDFNLYIPANALALAWVAGVACSLGLRDTNAEIILPAHTRLSMEWQGSPAGGGVGSRVNT